MDSISPDWDTTRHDYRALKNEWHVVARTDDLSDGGVLEVRLLGENLVLWRSSGALHAWKNYCIHRGAKLSMGWVKGERLICPYHGWEYGSDGQCIRFPAHPTITPSRRARAFRHRAEERYGYIWVSLGEPTTSIPVFPEWNDATYRKVHAGPYRYRANALRAVENFLDASHFPFVHANLNGVPDAPDPIEDYAVTLDENGLSTSDITVFQPYGDHRGIPVTATYRYTCFRPTTAYFKKKTGEIERFCTYMTVTPSDIDACVVWLIVAINFGAELTVERILARQDMVFEQDRRIVESQRPYPLPLESTAEFHTRSDRYGLEYRKWIKRLGSPTLDAGTATSLGHSVVVEEVRDGAEPAEVLEQGYGVARQ